LKVSFFQDKAGNFVRKHSEFIIKQGHRESAKLKEELTEIKITKPIFVTGLARSGTTILLEQLAAHQGLVSYRYKDFPFVHIPYWWENFLNKAGSNSIEKTERAHKDRIKISPDSPEAIEELLWMSFFQDSHDPSKSNLIDEDQIDHRFTGYYRNTIKKVLLSRKGERYLAKNNYNISRTKYLTNLFPDVKIIIAVRNPVDTIASLIKQHNLFCDVEKENPKVLSYMQNLGHFEFGLDRRPINFGNTDQALEIKQLLDEESITGYIKYWNMIYEYVSGLVNKNTSEQNLLLVDYDKFCENPITMLKSIYDFCEIDIEKSTIEKQAETISAPTYYKPKLSQKEIELIKKETSFVYSKLI